VPLITVYLLYTRRKTLDVGYRCSLVGAGLFAAIALAALWLGAGSAVTLSATDRVSATTVAYLSFVVAGGFGLLGSAWMAAALFPLVFLVFMVPLPETGKLCLEMQSVFASADASAFLFDATGTPLVREGTIFALPGIVLEVARECSGIRSSWVLLITSVLASHVLLTSPWRRVVLVAFVIPLAIIRNSFRILVIGLLCVHIGPHMIDSWIHHRGGPIFFVLSLVPLFLLLVLLLRTERRP
jgi:exosortase C (VPDSG-CTERM-specific)